MNLEIIIKNFDKDLIDIKKFKRHLWEYFGEILIDDIYINLKEPHTSLIKWEDNE